MPSQAAVTARWMNMVMEWMRGWVDEDGGVWLRGWIDEDGGVMFERLDG